MDLPLANTSDKAVQAILPFLKELSNDEWWTRLLTAWIKFEVKGPAKSVSAFLLTGFVQDLYIAAPAY